MTTETVHLWGSQGLLGKAMVDDEDIFAAYLAAMDASMEHAANEAGYTRVPDTQLRHDLQPVVATVTEEDVTWQPWDPSHGVALTYLCAVSIQVFRTPTAPQWTPETGDNG